MAQSFLNPAYPTPQKQASPMGMPNYGAQAMPQATPMASATTPPATPAMQPLSNPYNTAAGYQNVAHQYGFDPHGNNILGDMFPRLALGAYGTASSAQGFGNQLEPQRQNAIMQLLHSLSGGQGAQLSMFQHQLGEQGANAATQANMMNRGMGLGDGFNAGANAGIANSVAQGQNALAAQYASPEHQQAALQSILGAIGQGQQNPQLQTLLSLFGPIEQRQQANFQQQGQGFLGQIAPFIGALAGNPAALGMGHSQGAGTPMFDNGSGRMTQGDYQNMYMNQMGGY